PVVIAVSTSGATPVLARLLRSRIETAIPATYGRLASFAAQFRSELKARVSNSRARYRFWESLIHGVIAEKILAGKDSEAKQLADELMLEVSESEGSINQGEVYLVGAGPGDPDLLTFKALRLMQQADVVLYDRLIGDNILAMVRHEAERIYVGKMKNEHAMPQEEISLLLVKLAKQGKRVLRLKGGDPFTFGRGGEEIQLLAQNQVNFQVVPGITSAQGSSAYAGIPLTHRDHAQSCVFVTGHLKDGRPELDWQRLILPNQTIAIYMGLSGLSQISLSMIEHGADVDTPVAVIANATRPNQKLVTGTLSTISTEVSKAGLKSPAMIIVGSVVSLHKELAWFQGTS
ncbi:MAG: uroporphyrinogen-III C-methyltransferase, partial [Enterobacterales bacterium]|nr:uroporphyrinogen-III C-methyltransferase [Enterobacterales bacterium]